MSTLLKDFPELRKCIEGGHINAVRNAIKMGNQLHIIKAVIKGRKESWLDFIKDNFEISLRSCQNFMKLAKTPIHKNHYKYGIEGMLQLIRDGYDVSQPVLCPECKGEKL